MPYIDWDEDKNEFLKSVRGVSFEEVVVLIEAGEILDILEHPNKEKYPLQKIYVLWMNEYIYTVPFIEDEEKIFLKTIFPSRKLMKKYH